MQIEKAYLFARQISGIDSNIILFDKGFNPSYVPAGFDFNNKRTNILVPTIQETDEYTEKIYVDGDYDSDFAAGKIVCMDDGDRLDANLILNNGVLTYSYTPDEEWWKNVRKNYIIHFVNCSLKPYINIRYRTTGGNFYIMPYGGQSAPYDINEEQGYPETFGSWDVIKLPLNGENGEFILGILDIYIVHGRHEDEFTCEFDKIWLSDN